MVGQQAGDVPLPIHLKICQTSSGAAGDPFPVELGPVELGPVELGLVELGPVELGRADLVVKAVSMDQL